MYKLSKFFPRPTYKLPYLHHYTYIIYIIMSSNCPGTPTTRKPNIPQNKSSTKSIPPSLIITKSLINQNRRQQSFVIIYTDWKTVTQNSMECVRSPKSTPPYTKKLGTNIFIFCNPFQSDLFYKILMKINQWNQFITNSVNQRK